MIGYIAGKVLLKFPVLISFSFVRTFEQTKWNKYFLNSFFLFIELREAKEKAEIGTPFEKVRSFFQCFSVTFLFVEDKGKGRKKFW